MIVVTTPTGQVGRHVVDGLLEAEESVRVIVRNPDRLSQEVADRVEIVTGNHNDPAVTMKAFEGAEAVFYLVPPEVAANDVRGHYRAFAKSTASALVAHDVGRIVAVSTLGRGYNKEAGHLSAALEAEPVLEDTGVDYRTLRMPFFMDNLVNQVPALKAQGAFFMPNVADQQLLTVATSDIGAVAVDLLVDRDWIGQESVSVVGPDRLTPLQMAETLSDVLGSSIRYEQTSMDSYSANLLQYGMSQAWVRGLVDMAAAQNDGIYDLHGVDTAAGTSTSFRTWCEITLKPAFLQSTSQW